MIDEEDRQWIEDFYRDFEQGMKSIGKEYVRPKDYIKRALKILYGKKKGLRNYFNEE
jgi:hypothetical protein